MFGNYKQLRFLGNGRYFNVYEVLDERSNTKYAMKVLVSDDSEQYFTSEIRALNSISHENVIKMVDVMYSPQRLIVLELCTRGDLFDYVMNRTKVEEAEIKRYMYQLLAGVRALHEAGVCHRDIKLENILIDDCNNIKIADFGFCKMFDREKECPFFRTTCGTLQYCAPELFRCKRGYLYNGKKADAWSVGVVCFVLAFGYPPFNSASCMDLRFMYLKSYGNEKFWCNNIRNVSHIVSDEVRELIGKLLVVNPSLRWNIDEVVPREESTEKITEPLEIERDISHRKRKNV